MDVEYARAQQKRIALSARRTLLSILSAVQRSSARRNALKGFSQMLIKQNVILAKTVVPIAPQDSTTLKEPLVSKPAQLDP